MYCPVAQSEAFSCPLSAACEHELVVGSDDATSCVQLAIVSTQANFILVAHVASDDVDDVVLDPSDAAAVQKVDTISPRNASGNEWRATHWLT